MGGYGGNDEGSGGVTLSGGPEDIRDDSLASWGGAMGVAIGGGGLGGGRYVAYEGMYSEAERYHCGVYWESTNLWTLHGGGADAGVE